MPDATQRTEACARIMVGSGTDTYDPICDLAAGHDGPCKSTAAVDQHRITAPELCCKCRAQIPYARGVAVGVCIPCWEGVDAA